ncbi:MAG TPA: Crp/Fnr family transcriptional regulator [Pyrinomonadaceae bacterium]|jgi:CRP-like cAMP-binding protein
MSSLKELKPSATIEGSAENTRGGFPKPPAAGAFANRFLAALPKKTIRALTPFLETTVLPFEKIVYDAGERVDFVYFPVTAIVSERRVLESGDSSETVMMGREGVVGVMSLLSSPRAINRTQVLVAGGAHRIRREILVKQMAGDRALRNMIFAFIGEYIERVSRRAVCNNLHTARQRMCGWLLMVQNRKGGATLRLTQEQIGSNLGILRQVVGQIARELRSNEIIAFSRGKMTVLNRTELKRAACDCHSELANRP